MFPGNRGGFVASGFKTCPRFGPVSVYRPFSIHLVVCVVPITARLSRDHHNQPSSANGEISYRSSSADSRSQALKSHTCSFVCATHALISQTAVPLPCCHNHLYLVAIPNPPAYRRETLSVACTICSPPPTLFVHSPKYLPPVRPCFLAFLLVILSCRCRS